MTRDAGTLACRTASAADDSALGAFVAGKVFAPGERGEGEGTDQNRG